MEHKITGLYPVVNDDGLDSEGSTREVILKRPMFCGNCMIKMNIFKENMFRCPQCGMTYEKQEL